MTGRVAWPSAAAVVAMLGVSAASLSAQATSTRGVDVSVDAFGGWDVDLSPPILDPQTGASLTRDTGDQYGGVNSSLSLHRETKAVSFAATADASFRNYAAFGGRFVPSYTGTVRVGSAADARRLWSLSQSLSYAPVNALSFFPGGGGSAPSAAPSAGAPLVDYQISARKQFVSESGGSLGYRLSRRSALEFSGTYGILQAPNEIDASLLRRWSATGRYTHQTTRYTNLYAGYTYSRSQAPSGAVASVSPVVHGIDVGVGYGRPLSFSRHTNVSFQVGSTAVDDGNQPRTYQVVGAARVQHQLGRSWSVGGSFERNVRFVPAFLDPLLTNGFSIQASGQLGVRSSVEVLGNLSRGTVGVTEGITDANNSVDSSSFSAQYRFALRERFGLYAEYFYFASASGDAVSILDMVGRDQRRNGIRVGVTMGTTLLGVRR